MPVTQIPLNDGQKATSDDWEGINNQVINWMSDQDGSISVRPGIVPSDKLLTGDFSSSGKGIIGVYVWKNVADGFFYVVHVLQDRTIWALSLQTGVLSALSVASLTTRLDGSSSNVVFSEDSLRLMMVGGGQIQQWTGIGVTSRLAAYSIGVNQPPLLSSHIVNIGNYIVSNDLSASTANQIIWSDLGDGNHASWNPLNFNTADADPDVVVAVGANIREVVAFGTKSMQVFGLTSDPSLPFSSSTALKIGCSAPHSIITRDSDFALLDDQRRFIASNARDYEWIGKDIFKSIKDMSVVSDCKGFRLRIGFWDLLVWLFPSEKTAYVYDVERKDWRQWRGWNGVDDYAGIRISSYASSPEYNLHIVGDPLFSNLWTLDPDIPVDAGPLLPIVAEKITRPLDYSYFERKRCNKIRFFAKRGQTSVASPEPAFLDVAISNDGRAFSSFSRVNLGYNGDYSSFRDWFPGGIYRRRQLRIRYSSGIDLSVSGAIENWTPHDSGE